MKDFESLKKFKDVLIPFGMMFGCLVGIILGVIFPDYSLTSISLGAAIGLMFGAVLYSFDRDES